MGTRTQTATRRINLALQGGGAHGAFTWGAIDRLLDDPDIEIAAISGTSAGALNGAALKAGLAAGGRDGAREALNALWAQVGAVGDLRMANWFAALFPAAGFFSKLSEAAPVSANDIATQLFSPYAYGPFYSNPLQRIVESFPFGHVCADAGPALFISATNVRSGKIRVFSGAEITTEVILASACIPTVFQAVDITDPVTGAIDAYWDGGYAGNPALFPLFDQALPDDIVIVNINPLLRDEVPNTPQEIQNRINEISFNSSLLRELRAISFVKKLIRDGSVAQGAMKDVLVHMIADDALMNSLSAATKLSPSAQLLFRLKEAGRVAADSFLAQHKAKIGHEGSVDLVKMYQ